MKKIQLLRHIVQIVYALLLFTTFFVSLELFLIILLIATILGGAFYCGWLCPFGTMQDVVGDLSDIFKTKKVNIPKNIHKYAVFLRYIIFGIAILGFSYIIILDARISFLDVINGKKTAIISYIFLIIFIIFGWFFDRIFCNYFCILGARHGLFSALRIFRIIRNEKTCINCKLCDKKCPMNISISTKKYVHSLQCINCFKCISECPKKGTLKYSAIKIKDILELFKKRI